MMEPVSFADRAILPEAPSWAVTGTEETRRNLISSIYLEPDQLEQHVRELEAKYLRAERYESRAECHQTNDAEIVLVGYGIVARVLKAVVRRARERGMRVGLLRPISLYPFPVSQVREISRRARAILVVEMSTGQLIGDVRLALEGRCPVEFYGRWGGNVPCAEEVLEFIEQRFFGPGRMAVEEALTHA
jgi:pyruvate/2-oxoacid:ferredoxin oxidoreductase alpha subunit